MKILAYTSPARGHLYPLVPILDELTARGHRVAVRTLASEVELIRDRGFDAAPISPTIEAIEHDDYRARTPPAKLKRGMATFGKRSAHEVTDLQAAIDTEQPDAILVDCMTWGATAVAESWGGPWAQWFPFPLAMTSRDVPPFGPGLKPAAGAAGRARVPANARVERFIPHAPLLSHAVCAVTHGGAGATQKALASGVPVCVVPFGRDQLEVARRVEIADAGTRLPAQKLNPERLRRQIQLAMTKQDGARRLSIDGRARRPRWAGS